MPCAEEETGCRAGDAPDRSGGVAGISRAAARRVNQRGLALGLPTKNFQKTRKPSSHVVRTTRRISLEADGEFLIGGGIELPPERLDAGVAADFLLMPPMWPINLVARGVRFRRPTSWSGVW